MATQFDELFRRERALWQGQALQDIVDLGQQVVYAGLESLFTDLWTRLVPGASRSFGSFLQYLQEQVPGASGQLTAMLGALQQWADYEMQAKLLQFQEDMTRWLYNTTRDSAVAFGEKAQQAAGKFAPVQMRTNLSFNAVNRDALRWADQRSGFLVTGIDKVMRRNIQLIVANGQAGKATPMQMARDIYDFIPLLPSHTAALIKNRATMQANGMKPAAVNKVISSQAARYRRYRAQNIARTETIMANNYGVNAWVTQKSEQGLLPGSAVRVWIATRDDRTCDRCRPMHGKSAPIDGNWTAPGARAGTQVSLPIPPLHPSCRCAIGVYIAEAHTTTEVEAMFAPMLE